MIETRNYRSEEGYVLPYLSFSSYEALPYIRHMFTTREGGVSKDIYESLNLSFTRGDDETAVLENYRRVAQALGTSIDHIVTSDQTHTNQCETCGKGRSWQGDHAPRDYKDVDGMITDQPGVLLATFYADCVPLYFVDPVHKAIGLSHSGWRGTVGRMGQATVEAMEKSFGSQPKDLLCAIGPSICQDCYEVSRDVAEAFIFAFPTHEKEILQAGALGKYQLDLWKANEIVLTEAGVLKEHIDLAGLCTCCNSSILFSHRASKGKRGNLGAFLMLTE